MRRIEDPGAETSNQNNSSWDPTEHHGAKIKGKEEEVIRIMTVQINSFPTSTNQNDKIKIKTLKELIQNATPDFMLTQEDNKNWTQVDPTRRPKEMGKNWVRALNVHSARNVHNNTHNQHLTGGVSIWTMNDATHHSAGKGIDLQKWEDGHGSESREETTLIPESTQYTAHANPTDH